MTVREILKMGDPRLLRVAQAVTTFKTAELQALLKDLDDTMIAANGAGLAAPQIGVDLQFHPTVGHITHVGIDAVGEVSTESTPLEPLVPDPGYPAPPPPAPGPVTVTEPPAKP